MNLHRWMFLISFLALTSSAVAAEITIESGPEQTSLVELFTSEGCSSCPPADARLTEFMNDPNLWITFVPVSFHVDYWNGLGWSDRFAKNEFTERQRSYAKQWASSYLYTPNFVLDGAEWKEWYQKGMFSHKKTTIAGTLRAEVDHGQISVYFDFPNHQKESFRAYFTVLGFGLESAVNHGENSGKKLSHNFVALHYQEKKLQLKPDQNMWISKISVPVIREPVKRKAIAVWVSREGGLAPIQATGGFID